MSHFGIYFCHFAWLFFLLIFNGIFCPADVANEKEDFALFKLNSNGRSKLNEVALGHILSEMECKMNSTNKEDGNSIELWVEICIPKEEFDKCNPQNAEKSSFIICYLSKLDKGMADEHFLIENLPSKELLAKCKETFPEEKGQFHAIHLEPASLIGGNMKSISLELSTSFSEKKYHILVLDDGCTYFPLVPFFGEPEEDEIKEEIGAELRAEARKAMEEIPNGIKLGEHAGLWLWAMDLAHPFEDSEGKTSMAAIGQGCPVEMNIIMALKNRENFTNCQTFWAFVVPAFFDFNLIKMDNNEADEVITKYSVRNGYIFDLDGLSVDGGKLFTEYTRDISKMAIALVLSIGNEESKEWLEMGNVKDKLTNLPVGPVLQFLSHMLRLF